MAQRKPKEARVKQALEMLAAGTPVIDVARRMGVGRSTVHRWQKHYAEQLNERTEQTVKTIGEQLQELNGRAVEALDELLRSDDDKVRLQAARTILSRAGYPEGKDVDMHVSGLEQKSDEELARELAALQRQLLAEGEG